MLKSKNLTFKSFIVLLQNFIQNNAKNYQNKLNGKNITAQTLANYIYLHKLLLKFHQSGFEIEIVIGKSTNANFARKQKKTWQTLYIKFTNFLYNNGYFDNYVGANIKMLKTFCKWLELEKGINIGNFYRSFKIVKEDIPILVLQPEQLRFLINDEKFKAILSDKMKKIKDLFVFGCTVGLRISDLMLLRKSNIEIINEVWYLKVYSKKTNVFTKIKLPYFAIEIVKRNKSKSVYLFYEVKNLNLNQKFKELAELAGWTHQLVKIRMRRGKPIEIYKDPKKKTHYRFCDLISTHTMRRTAITTLLSLGMDEPSVRKISGHAPGSAEFYRYVQYHQQNLDEKTDLAFEKLQNLS